MDESTLFTREEYAEWAMTCGDEYTRNLLRTCPTAVQPEFYGVWASRQTTETLLYWYGWRKSSVYNASRDELSRRIVLVPGMMEDRVHGQFDAICSQCGKGFKEQDIKSAMVHIGSNGICGNGFTADRTCDCGKKFDSIHDANKHRVKSDCLAYRLAKKKLYCEPCQFQALDKKTHAEHLKTKAHYKATHPDEFLCVPCDHRSRCKTEHEAHLVSKSHKQVVEPVVLRCEVCDVNFRCKAEQDRHLSGKQHLYKADPTKRPTLTCELCGITRPSHAQYQAHLATAKHRKKAAACLEDPSSPDDADASGCPDTR